MSTNRSTYNDCISQWRIPGIVEWMNRWMVCSRVVRSVSPRFVLLTCLVQNVGMEYNSGWVYLPVSLPICLVACFFFFFFAIQSKYLLIGRLMRIGDYSTGSYICMFLACTASPSLLVCMHLWYQGPGFEPGLRDCILTCVHMLRIQSN